MSNRPRHLSRRRFLMQTGGLAAGTMARSGDAMDHGEIVAAGTPSSSRADEMVDQNRDV